MKKLLSLLLAGLMVFALAGSVLAGTVFPANNDIIVLSGAPKSIFDSNNRYVYETILGNNGHNWFYNYTNDENYYNWLYWYWLHNGGKLPEMDPVDPGFSVTPNVDIPTGGTTKCTYLVDTCASTGKVPCGKTSQVYYSTQNGKTYTIKYKCPDHGWQDFSDSTITTPGFGVHPIFPMTYSVSASAGYGGSITLNGSSSNLSVAKGEDVTVSIVPDYGFDIAAVYLNGYYMGPVSSLSLDDIAQNYSVRATFVKVDTKRVYTITASAGAGGTVEAVVDGKDVGSVSSISGTYANIVSLKFVPKNDSYVVDKVVINGVDMGSITSYQAGRMRSNLNISVTFKWDNPYTDIAKEHLAAVQYVTDIDVMGSPNLHFDTDKFMGKNTVSVNAMACYLAELADVNGMLNNITDRITWATDKGLITAEENLAVEATWTRACDMLTAFVRNLEKDGKVTFKALEKVETAYDVAKAMELVTEASYKADGKITRYDMAEICYAVSLLEVK